MSAAIPATATPEVVAKAFCNHLRAALGPVRMSEVVKRNRESADPNTCASHDFCDANMVMDAAMRECGVSMDFEGDDGEEGGMPLAVVDLWNASWDKAKEAEFDPEDVKP